MRYQSIKFVRRIVPETATCFGVETPAGPCQTALDFLARTSGLNQAHQDAYVALICGLVSDGLWSMLDLLYIFATADQTTALLNLVSTNFTGTANGTVSFTADVGYTGDASSFYISTGYTPLVNAVQGLQDSTSTGVYVLNNRTSPESSQLFGITDTVTGGVRAFQLAPNFGGTTFDALHSNSGSNTAPATIQGFWILSRTASDSVDVYDGAASFFYNEANTSVGLENFELYIFARNLEGTADRFCSDQISAFFVGAGLTSSQVAQISSRINTYMTTFGINVY